MVLGVDGVTFPFVTLIAGVGVLGLLRACVARANAIDLYKPVRIRLVRRRLIFA